MPNDSTVTFTSLYGQGRINQLGGVFINGRPLPVDTRKRIVELYKNGVKSCNISRDLRVSHGAVSKIINRFNQTGSISPGQIGGNPRSRRPIQSVEKDIQKLKKDNPHLSAADIRVLLIKNGICVKKNAPSIPSINRFLKTKSKRILQDSTQQQQSAYNNLKSETPSPVSNGTGLKYSIDSILSLDDSKISPNDTATSSSNTSHFSSALSTNSDEENCGSTAGQMVLKSVRASSKFENAVDNSESSSTASSSRDLNSPETSTKYNQSENRRNRTSFTTEQLKNLEAAFALDTYPSNEQREHLMKITNLDEDKIITWFSNRRARNRKIYANGNGQAASLPVNNLQTVPTPPIPQPIPQIINPLIGNQILMEMLKNNTNNHNNQLAMMQNAMLGNSFLDFLTSLYSNSNPNMLASLIQQQQLLQQQQNANQLPPNFLPTQRFQ